MKSLLESLLDDDDKLFKDTNADPIIKENIIDFIDKNYAVYNGNWRQLDIKKYLKINKKGKDFIVDLKNINKEIYGMNAIYNIDNDRNDPFPNNGKFKWGNIDVKYSIPSEVTNNSIKSSIIPEHISIIDLTRTHFKDLKGIPDCDLLYISNSNYFESTKGCPKSLISLNIHDCQNFKSFSECNENLSSLSLYHVSSLELIDCDFKKLTYLYLDNCSKLKNIDNLQNSFKKAKLDIRSCFNLITNIKQKYPVNDPKVSLSEYFSSFDLSRLVVDRKCIK